MNGVIFKREVELGIHAHACALRGAWEEASPDSKSLCLNKVSQWDQSHRVSVHVVSNIMRPHINIKFCYKLGLTATKIHELVMLMQVYGSEDVKKCLYDWFICLCHSKVSIDGEPRLGRPSTSTSPNKKETKCGSCLLMTESHECLQVLKGLHFAHIQEMK